MIKSNWLTSGLANQISYNLHHFKDIPDYIGYNIPSIVTSMESFHNLKDLPSDTNSILYKERVLLQREIASLKDKLIGFSRVNIINISEASLEAIVPFLFEFQSSDNIGNFTIVSPNDKYNQTIAKQVASIGAELGINDIKTNAITAEPELGDFIVNDKKYDPNERNIFLLMNSRLGNSRNPKMLLQNIYNSMFPGDTLVVLQGLYRKGMEDSLVNDYSSMLLNNSYAEVDKQLLEVLAEDYQKFVKWTDQEGKTGIMMGVKLSSGLSFDGVEMEPNSEFTIFRSIRFNLIDLITIYQDIGLIIKNISFDNDQNFGLFILQKPF